MAPGGDQKDVAAAVTLDEVGQPESALHTHVPLESRERHEVLDRRALRSVADDRHGRVDTAAADREQGPHREQRVLLWMKLRDEEQGERRPRADVRRVERCMIDPGTHDSRGAIVRGTNVTCGFVAQDEDLASDPRRGVAEEGAGAPHERVEWPNPRGFIRRQPCGDLVAGPDHGQPEERARDRRDQRAGQIVRVEHIRAAAGPQDEPEQHERTGQERERARPGEQSGQRRGRQDIPAPRGRLGKPVPIDE